MDKPNWSSALPARSNADYCPKCEYPIRDNYPPCDNCVEQSKTDAEQVKYWSAQLGGMRAWKDYLDSKFVKTDYNLAAYTAIKEWNRYESNLFLSGPRGVGKSHLAAIAKRPLIMKGIHVLTVCMQDVIAESMEHIKTAKVANDWVWKMVKAPVLSLEDLGIEKPSDYVCGFFYRVIDGRYRAGRNGMLVTSNFSLNQLEGRWAGFDPHGRVTSRLREMCAEYAVLDKDWRAEKK